MSPRRRQKLLTITAALGGLVLFAWAARRAGISEIIDGIRRVGWGLIPILALGGLRFLLRAEAWRLCTSPDRRLSLRQAFTSFLAGDAIGNVTPFGMLASEPTKVLLTRRHLDTRDSISSLAVDNLVYAFSVVTVIAAAAVLMLLTVPRLPFFWREWGWVSLVVLAGGVFLAVRGVRGRSGLGVLVPADWRRKVHAVRVQVLESSAGHPLRLWRVFALDMTFHALAVLEAYLALRWLLGNESPSFREALLFEALNRVVTVLFKFVPFRVGVDEASSGALAPLLGINPVVGVSLAVVRKVRNLFWSAIGMGLIAFHHAQATPATGHHGNASVRRT